jgi:ParB-like chromosome segregation protein Spo0J
MKIHPAADIFPMMSDEELQDLAADIKESGLIHPIVTDADGEVLIDGRNRLAACKIAGVEPTFEKLNGQDAVAYIVSTNLARRTLTKGQQAMSLAMIYPEPEKTAPGKRQK